jgi:hypothetical protein
LLVGARSAPTKLQGGKMLGYNQFMMALIASTIAVVGLAGLWWFVFRNAMKHPNNGNEFSRDDSDTP